MEQQDQFLSTVLDSGLQIVGQPIPGVESAAIGILIGAGARDEPDGKFGISHFTEQMLFRGTEHLSARELSDRFDILGISYDSSAGLEMTLVNGVLLGSRVSEALDLLADVVRFPAFSAESIDNVRTLLLQELQQREDQPAQLAMDTVRRIFFADTPLSHDVLGTVETVSALSRNDLIDYWTDRYTVNNMVVSVAGTFDWDAVVEQLATLTAGWPKGSGRNVFHEPAARSGIEVIAKDMTQEHIGFALPGVAVTDPHFYTASVVSQVLGGSSNSRLFRSVREERGLAYAVQCRFDGLEKSGLFRIYVGTSVERAHESVEVVLDELRKLKVSGITDEELALAKTRLKSQLVMRSESTSARMVANVRSWWFEGRLRSLDEIRQRIDHVTVEEVSAFLDGIDMTGTLAAVAVGPRSEEELFGGLLAHV